MGICDKCGERLIEIDYTASAYRLRGCNKWDAWRQNRVLELNEDDLAAVRERLRT